MEAGIIAIAAGWGYEIDKAAANIYAETTDNLKNILLSNHLT